MESPFCGVIISSGPTKLSGHSLHIDTSKLFKSVVTETKEHFHKMANQLLFRVFYLESYLVIPQ